MVLCMLPGRDPPLVPHTSASRKLSLGLQRHPLEVTDPALVLPSPHQK
jgi:hypothetical protein